MHVFTYGTLMFPEIWRTVAGKLFATVEGEAAGYAIFRVREAVFPGIIKSHGDSVRGIVYLDVDSAALARLDRFEDEFYERLAISINCGDGVQRSAETYVVAQANRDVLTREPWTSEAFVASGGLEQFTSRFAGFGRVVDGD